jgi:tetratricopeptide (TPR) repeat protein
LNRCLTYWPLDAEVLSLAARLERLEGRFEAAEALLEKCVRHNGPTSFSSLEATLLQVQRGDLEEEGLLLGLVDSGNRQSPWILEALARAHLAALRFRPALNRLEKWLKIQPDCPRALELQGRILEHTGWADKAVQIYERLLQQHPGHWQVRLRLVAMLLASAALEQASLHLEMLERDQGDNADVQVALGQRDNLLNHPEQARQRFQLALAIDPDHVGALLQLGKLDMQRDRLVEAERRLTRALQLRSFDLDIHFNLVRCYGLAGKKAQAEIHRLKYEALRKNTNRLNDLLLEKVPAAPKDPALLTEAGRLFLAVGEERRGIDWFKRALTFDPNYRPAHAALADYYKQARQPEKAAGHRAPTRPETEKRSTGKDQP